MISVIIPVFNGQGTLKGCLDAVYASQCDDFEVIIVDDGSTDGSLAVASRYPCRVIELPHNVGAAVAKNRGAEIAQGEILFFTDADVHIQPTTLGIVAENLADPQIDGVVGLLGESCPYPNYASQFKNLWMHFTYRRQPRQVGLFFTSAAAIRREIFITEGGFDPHYAGASITEDIEFGQRLLGRGFTIIMDQRLTVEHQKHYAAREVLGTDLFRARGLTQTWLRNRRRSDSGAHYASVPWYFGAGVGALGAATLLALLGMVTTSGEILAAAGLAVLAAIGLNLPFLIALGRLRGAWFLVQSIGFLLLDLYASGLGIGLGIVDYARGRQY